MQAAVSCQHRVAASTSSAADRAPIVCRPHKAPPLAQTLWPSPQRSVACQVASLQPPPLQQWTSFQTAASLPEDREIQGLQPAEAHHAEDTQLQAATATPLTQEELDAKERERRAKISAANSGRQPWNKGRKHSAETIAKIRARTREAMQRPDVVQAYKEGMAKALEKKSVEKQSHPGAPVKVLKVPKSEADEVGGDGASCWDCHQSASRGGGGDPWLRSIQRKAAGGGSALSVSAEGWHAEWFGTDEVLQAKRLRAAARAASAEPKPRKPRAKKEPADSTAPAVPKKRGPASEEHRRAISEAIRAKWQDPEYRAKTMVGIHKHAEQSFGIKGVDTARPRARSTQSSSNSSSGPRSSRPKASSSASSSPAAQKAAAAAKERKLREERLAQIQVLVQQILNTRKLVARMDLNVEAMRIKTAAFQNDPRMASKAAAQVAEAESMIAVAKTKLRTLQSQIPPGITFDSQGRVTVQDPSVLSSFSVSQSGNRAPGNGATAGTASGSPADATVEVQVAQTGSAGSSDGHSMGAAAPAVQQPVEVVVVPPSSLLSHLDPEAMRVPLHAVPDVSGMHPPHANGYANGHHANGHHQANGHHANGFHANGHANGYSNGHSLSNGHPVSNGHGVSVESSVARLVEPLSAADLLSGSTGQAAEAMQPQQGVLNSDSTVVVPAEVHTTVVRVGTQASGLAVSSGRRAAVGVRRATASPTAAGSSSAVSDGEFVQSTRSRSVRKR